MADLDVLAISTNRIIFRNESLEEIDGW